MALEPVFQVKVIHVVVVLGDGELATLGRDDGVLGKFVTTDRLNALTLLIGALCVLSDLLKFMVVAESYLGSDLVVCILQSTVAD